VGIVIGMFGLTQVEADTPYWQLIAWLFVMGLGMGGTMMPLFTSALKTLTSHQVARGSTLLNVTQQIASSVGVALMSVLLTNGFKSSDAVSAAQAANEAKEAVVPAPADAVEVMRSLGDQFQAVVQSDMAEAFANTYWVAWALVVLTIVPALFLPRKREVSHLLDDQEDTAPVVVH
jgi:hypothetical protein